MDADPALVTAVVSRLFPQGQAGSAMLLPLLARRTGWEDLEMERAEAFSADPGDAERALRLGPAIGEAVAGGVLDAGLAEAWSAAIGRASAAGTLRLRIEATRLTMRYGRRAVARLRALAGADRHDARAESRRRVEDEVDGLPA